MIKASKSFFKMIFPDRKNMIDKNILNQEIPTQYDNGLFFKERRAIFDKISRDRREVEE